MYKVDLIVATDQKGLMGLNGNIPWHIPEDLKHFRGATLGKAVIMGRKTMESIGKILDFRINIVVSTTLSHKDGYYIAKDFNEALEIASASGLPIMVIGGRTLYKEALERGIVDKIHATMVHLNITIGEGDQTTFFPKELVNKIGYDVAIITSYVSKDGTNVTMGIMVKT